MEGDITIALSVNDIAKSIKKLKRDDKEMLLLFLSGEDREIKKRVSDFKMKNVETMSREEILKDVL